MDGMTFDTLACSKTLIKLGFTRDRRKVLPNLPGRSDDADRIVFEALRTDMRDKLDARGEALRRELSTRADLQAEIRATELRFLKWQIGIAIAIGTAMLTGFGCLAVIMARGFGWLWL